MSVDALSTIAALSAVDDHVRSAQAEVDRLLALPAMRRRAPVVAAEAALRGARASAALDGAEWGLEAVRDYASAGPLEVRGDPLILAALRLSIEAPAVVPVWRRAPLQALARLHLVAASGAVPEQELGRPRPGDGVAGRLVALGALVAAARVSSALILSAVVHAELLALQPFGWGNGPVARAAARVVLLDRGFAGAAVVVADVGHAELGKPVYDDAIVRYATGTPEGVGDWVRHVTEAVRLAARDSIAICESLDRQG